MCQELKECTGNEPLAEVRVNEVINCYRTRFEDEVNQTIVIREESLEKCFLKVYALQRGARYDSGRYYEVADKQMAEQYRRWVKQNETIELYYGSATVD